VSGLGKDAEYAFGLTLWEPSLKRPGSPEFTEKYRSAYNALPAYHAAGGYSGCQILEAAVKKAGALNRQKIRDALASLELETVWGPYKVDDKGQQLAKTSYVIQILKGKREIVWPQPEATAAMVFPTPEWEKRR
jgi:branched-chain amino acid transport system substrate-binding protein